MRERQAEDRIVRNRVPVDEFLHDVAVRAEWQHEGDHLDAFADLRGEHVPLRLARHVRAGHGAESFRLGRGGGRGRGRAVGEAVLPSHDDVASSGSVAMETALHVHGVVGVTLGFEAPGAGRATG